MSEKISEFLVLEILFSGNYGETCYKVKHKQKDSLFIWKAYDCRYHSSEQINNISNEVKMLNSLQNGSLIAYYETITHLPSNTLYIVTELHPSQNLPDMIAKCKTDNIIFNEKFIWNMLYRISEVSKIIDSIKVNVLHKQIKTSSIFVEGLKILVDPFCLKSTVSGDIARCCNLICQVGQVLYEICTLNKWSEKCNDVKFQYSEDLQNTVNLLLQCNTRKRKCQFQPDIVLRHPAVLLNINTDVVEIFQTPGCGMITPNCSNDSAFESDESIIKIQPRKSLSLEDLNMSPKNSVISDISITVENKSIPKTRFNATNNINHLSPTLIALDLKIPGYVPPKVSENVLKWRSRLELCREPEQVSEEALSQVWLRRLAELREREDAVRNKEKEIRRQTVFSQIHDKLNSENVFEKNDSLLKDFKAKDMEKSMSGITLQSTMTPKVLDDHNHVELSALSINNFGNMKNEKCSHSDGSVSGKSQSSNWKRNHRRSSSVKTRYRKKKPLSYEDMNSSLSADQGDTSILPTSGKMSSDAVPRPKSLHNISRRKVHFNSRNNPFAEYDSISSTTLTFFEIENVNNTSYEIPSVVPNPQTNIADRIAKFTYLDLQEMTDKKRALMEELRKTPPKVNRATKPTLKSKVRAAENIKKFSVPSSSRVLMNSQYENNDFSKSCIPSRPPSASSRYSMCSSQSGSSYKSTSSFTSARKDDRRKTIAPVVVDIDFENDDKYQDDNNENNVTPAPKLKKDSKRRSILGFKTPFKFKL